MYLDKQFQTLLSQDFEMDEELSAVSTIRTPTNILQQQKAEMTTYPDTKLKNANCCRFRKFFVDGNVYLVLVLVFLIYLVILKNQ